MNKHNSSVWHGQAAGAASCSSGLPVRWRARFTGNPRHKKTWRGLPVPHMLFIVLALGLHAEENMPKQDGLSLEWSKNVLTIKGAALPTGQIQINYLEAYCRPGSTDRDWGQTVIGHKTSLVEATPDGKRLKLHCDVKDGIVVEHQIIAGKDDVSFELEASNPTATASDAQWVQPCIQAGPFTSLTPETYLPKCFIFVDGKLARLPTQPWATKARYMPGQVWCPKHVDRNDVNPRPLSSIAPSNGLMGVFSGDEKTILATAWEPYQELFQGIYACIHSDFRIGGLKPGERKKIRGKIYVVPADVDALVRRYEKDFPEHSAK
ncbi:MAG TPA: hypothetical protein VGP72_21850 [Planctomycetota bacterium]|jgi:hypothetical protein